MTNTSSTAAATSMSGNLGTAQFRFVGGAYPGTNGTCGASLAANATCAVEVAFAPSSDGVKNDSITINYTNSSAQTATRAVTGTATAPAGPPAAPTTLVAFPDVMSGGIMLTWADNANNETGYEVYRSTTSGYGFVLISSLGAGASSDSDSNVTGGTTYYYYVVAVNGFGSAAQSNEASTVAQ